ncbi:MAG: cytochrome c4 [Gammaproteobacteria bacterium]|nr:cytochrome c4 [Gammaproteobacteria bacterium]
MRPLFCLFVLLLVSSLNVRAEDTAAGMPAKAATCIACHGPGGNSTDPQYPVLAGQMSRYIYLQLKDYKQDRRAHPLMTPIAKSLSTEEMIELGDYFAAQKRTGQVEQGDPALIARGQKVADDALCTMCHLGAMAGQNEVPRVNGQHYSYILGQLMDLKHGKRTNDAGNMSAVVKTLSDDDLKALAAWNANLQ